MTGTSRAFALGFLYALAATLAQAAVRAVLGNQIANCALLALLWAAFYAAMAPGGRGRNKNKRR